MFKKILITVFIVITFFLSCNSLVRAEEVPQEEYVKAQVIEILEEGEKDLGEGIRHNFQKLRIKLLEAEELKEIEYGGNFDLRESQKAKKNDTLILLKQKTPDGKSQYFIADKYRLGNIVFIFFLFFLVVILIGGLKGFSSMIGMLISLLIVLKFIVPQILAGRNPLFISIIGSLIILVSTIYLAHGINKKTHLAVISTSICLILTGILSIIFVQMALLTGLGSEEAYSLTLGPTANINFKGLLLGGIIIGALGVLDDITIGQTSAVFELNQVNPKISFEELLKRGLNIGREHIAATVNTLVLAYVGASLSLFLIFFISAHGQPFWMILNSEVIAEEIIRTLAGSIGLVLAVPLTTFLAAWYLKKKS